MEKTQLPDFILADLYKNTLIVLDDIVVSDKQVATTIKQPIQQQEAALSVIQEPVVNPTAITPKEKQVEEPVVVYEATPAPIVVAPTTKWFLGDNRKNFCVLVKDPTAAYLREESLNLLVKILENCHNHNLGDVAIVNLAHRQVSYTHLQENLSPKYLFTFGVDSNEIGLPFAIPFYQIQQYNNCTFLMSPSLEILEANVAEKKSLWGSLKKIFVK